MKKLNLYEIWKSFVRILTEKQTVEEPTNCPAIIRLEETEESITQLVSKTEISTTPNAGDIVKDTTFLKELPDGNYWKEEFPKEKIVLHFTAGHTWESAYAQFKTGSRVATPFIVDIKGPKYIVQLFDEKYWAYHLGIDRLYSQNWINDKRSIGIEIVNIGPAWFKNGTWKDYTGKIWPAEKVVPGKNRDADGGIAFPQEQVDAVCDLVNYLCDKWNIAKQVPKDKSSFQLPGITEFKGIVTHQMFRHDKYDIGNAWPWGKMIERCQLKEV